MNRGFRSTPRTASTARRATSRTRPRTSTGSLPKAAEAPITRTCKWLAAPRWRRWRLAALAGGGAARLSRPGADLCPGARGGDERRPCARRAAARGARRRPAGPGRHRPQGAERSDRRRADGPGAEASRGRVPPAKLPTDARLLLVAEEIRRRPSRAGAALARVRRATTATSPSWRR